MDVTTLLILLLILPGAMIASFYRAAINWAIKEKEDKQYKEHASARAGDHPAVTSGND